MELLIASAVFFTALSGVVILIGVEIRRRFIERERRRVRIAMRFTKKLEETQAYCNVCGPQVNTKLEIVAAPR